MDRRIARTCNCPCGAGSFMPLSEPVNYWVLAYCKGCGDIAIDGNGRHCLILGVGGVCTEHVESAIEYVGGIKQLRPEPMSRDFVVGLRAQQIQRKFDRLRHLRGMR